MGSGVFENCANIESAKLSENLTTIPDGSFRGCYSLKTVSFSSSLTNVESEAFKDCKSLTSITLPKTINTLGSYAWGRLWPDVFKGCSNLKIVNIKAMAPFSLSSVLDHTKAIVYVPEVSLEAYQKYNEAKYKDRFKALLTTAGD